MAKFKIETELDNGKVTGGIRDIDKRMRGLTKSAQEFNKEFEKTGNGRAKDKALDQLNKALDLSKQKAKQLREELDKAVAGNKSPKTIENLKTSLLNAQTQTKGLQNAIRGIDGSLASSAERAGFFGKVMNLATKSDKVSKLVDTFTAFKGRVGEANGFLGKMGVISGGAFNVMKSGAVLAGNALKAGVVGGAKASAVALQGMASVATGTIKGLATVGTAVGGALAVVSKTAMNTYDEMARGSRAMSNSLSDGQKGADEFQASIKKMGSAGLADMGSLTDIAKNLSSSLNLSGKEAFKMSTGILDIGTAFGMTKQQIESFGLVSSQIFSAGKLMAQDYNQLIASGAAGPIKKWIAEHNEAGITMDNFKEQVNDGAVSADMYREALDALGMEFKGAGQEVMTFGDAFENAGKAFTMSYIENMKPFLAQFGTDINQASDAMGDMATEAGKASASFLQGGWSSIQTVVSQLATGMEGLSFNASAVAETMGTQLGLAIANLIPNMSELQVISQLLTGAWNFLISLVTQITSLISVFADSFLQGAGAIGQTGGATERVNEIFGTLHGILGQLASGLQPLIQLIGQTAGQLFDMAGKALEALRSSGLLNDILSILTSVVKGVIDAVKGMVNKFLESSGLLDKNSDSAKALKTIFELLKKVISAVVDILGPLLSFLGDLIGTALKVASVVVNVADNLGLFEWALKTLKSGIENFIGIAQGFLDTISGIARAIGDAWNAIFKSAEESVHDEDLEFTVHGDFDIPETPDFGFDDDFGEYEFFTKGVSGIFDGLAKSSNMFGKMASRPSGNTGNSIGTLSVNINGAQDTKAVMEEFKGVMRRNGMPLRHN